MGARDLDNTAWRRRSAIRERLRTFLDRRGYDAVELPTLEQTDLFLRKSGGELAARMYSFTDPSGRSVSLRPEFTSSVVRAYVDGSLRGPLPLRLQYAGPVFRYEPSADGSGALEYEQLGAELLGVAGEAADAEVIALAAQGLALLGVSGHRVRVSHVGVVNAILEAMGLTERARVFIHGNLGLLRAEGGAEEARRRAEALGILSGGRARRLSALAARLDPDEAREMVEALFADTVAAGAGQRTPEEILRRYLKKVREAEDPARVERALSFAAGLADAAGEPEAARKRAAELLAEHSLDDGLLAPIDRLFDALGRYDLMGAPLVLDLGATSGIAYYTGVVFEVEHAAVAGAPPLGGGGRYDGLVKALGEAQDIPALGFALSLERVSELLPDGFGDADAPSAGRVLVTAQETAVGQAVATAERLRAQGIPVELDLSHDGDAAAAAYAKRRGIETIMRVGRDGSVDERPA